MKMHTQLFFQNVSTLTYDHLDTENIVAEYNKILEPVNVFENVIDNIFVIEVPITSNALSDFAGVQPKKPTTLLLTFN